MIAVDHAAQPVRQFFARSAGEQAKVAADREVRPVAGGQDGANIWPFGARKFSSNDGPAGRCTRVWNDRFWR
jgi:hypothetical protein